MQPYHTTQIQSCLDRILAGDKPARDDVIQYTYERLHILTRKLLAGYPALRKWEHTDDVLHNAAIRLWKSLEDVQPDNVRKFFALAALQIRRELFDLVRHYGGPQGHAAHPNQPPQPVCDTDRPVRESTDPTDGPVTLSEWTELHGIIQQLPEEEREVFDLVYYHGFSQPKAADVLGVSLRTVKRRWLRARRHVFEAFHGPATPT